MVFSFTVGVHALNSSEYTEVAFPRDLKYGMMDSSDVGELQAFLTMHGYLPSVVPTGDFSKDTFIAVKKFQKYNNLPQTGFVGSRTRVLMNRMTAESAFLKNCIGTAPCINILSPTNESLFIGSTYTIKWATRSVPLDALVLLELKKRGRTRRVDKTKHTSV